MASTTSRGNYYKNKTKKYYEDLGYTTQITEFMCGRMIPGRMIYVKKDVFGSDGISMNGKELIFWNSKHYTSEDSRRVQLNKAKKEFEQFPFPSNVKRVVAMWKPRARQPEIIQYED